MAYQIHDDTCTLIGKIIEFQDSEVIVVPFKKEEADELIEIMAELTIQKDLYWEILKDVGYYNKGEFIKTSRIPRSKIQIYNKQ